MSDKFIKQVPNVAGAAESANLSGIFIQLLLDILSETAKQIMFPFAAFTSILQAMLTYRQLYLEKGKERGAIFRAVVQTISAIAITVAVVGGLAFAAVFGLAAPIIFTVVLGINTLINFGSACFYYGKYLATKDPEDYTKAKNNAIAAFAGLLATVGVGLVLLGGIKVCAVFGIVAGAVGMMHSIVNAYKTYKKSKIEEVENPIRDEKPVNNEENEPLITNDPSMTLLHRTFPPTKTHNQQNEVSDEKYQTKKVVSIVRPTVTLEHNNLIRSKSSPNFSR